VTRTIGVVGTVKGVGSPPIGLADAAAGTLAPSASATAVAYLI
jgi:hypothetical protein